MLLHKDCSDLCRNHRDDGADVIFKPVRKAASSRDAVFIEMRHVQSHAFHLCNYPQTDRHKTRKINAY